MRTRCTMQSGKIGVLVNFIIAQLFFVTVSLVKKKSERIERFLFHKIPAYKNRLPMEKTNKHLNSSWANNSKLGKSSPFQNMFQVLYIVRKIIFSRISNIQFNSLITRWHFLVSSICMIWVFPFHFTSIKKIRNHP